MPQDLDEAMDMLRERVRSNVHERAKQRLRRALFESCDQRAASAAWRARNARVFTAATDSPSSFAISVSVRPSA